MRMGNQKASASDRGSYGFQEVAIIDCETAGLVEYIVGLTLGTGKES